ncbi:hypothetical protein ACIPJ1_10020 [Microbacterium maritypicum]|uniref:hypothetical protein n=1 Tax=Microbacterium maritypicum TaxID=33918 RepID=UPI003810FD66
MSEPQQPPVPTAHLPAAPQYPAAAQYPATPQRSTPPPPSPAPAPDGSPPSSTASSTPYPPSSPTAYPAPTPGWQAYAPAHPAFPGQAIPPAQARTGNPLAVAAFVIAVATLAVNLFSSVARPFVYGGDGGFAFMLAFDNGIGILSFFAYVVALVLGLIAVRRPTNRLLTGIAVGIAGAGAIGIAVTGLTIALYQYF